MVDWPDTSSIFSALELFREELEKTKSQVAAHVGVETSAVDYDKSRQLIAQAQEIDGIIEKTNTLKAKLTNLFVEADSGKPSILSVPNGQSLLREDIQLVLKKSTCNAQALYDSNSVVVLSGSRLASKVHSSLSDRELKCRQKLQRHGELTGTKLDRMLVLNTDCRFPSPSAAASFVVGHSASGNRDWVVVKTKESLGKWRKRKDR